VDEEPLIVQVKRTPMGTKRQCRASSTLSTGLLELLNRRMCLVDVFIRTIPKIRLCSWREIQQLTHLVSIRERQIQILAKFSVEVLHKRVLIGGMRVV
jgi:hypothetical protein